MGRIVVGVDCSDSGRRLAWERVRPVIVEGRPSAVLIEQSKNALFVVMGSGRNPVRSPNRSSAMNEPVVLHPRFHLRLMHPHQEWRTGYLSAYTS